MYTISKNKWIKNKHLDTIDGRIQLGFFRCPDCNEWVGVYRDNLYEESGESRGRIKCSKSTCHFYEHIVLKGWKK